MFWIYVYSEVLRETLVIFRNDLQERNISSKLPYALVPIFNTQK